MAGQKTEAGAVRIDKWLWAARFFKTRGLAADAVRNGRVGLNGSRPKPSRAVHPGDRLRILRGGLEYRLEVLAVSDKRGSASAAQALYVEDPDSAAARGRRAAELRAEARSQPRFEGRPDRRSRRELLRLKQGR